jgi:hypothetical protein
MVFHMGDFLLFVAGQRAADCSRSRVTVAPAGRQVNRPARVLLDSFLATPTAVVYEMMGTSYRRPLAIPTFTSI